MSGSGRQLQSRWQGSYSSGPAVCVESQEKNYFWLFPLLYPNKQPVFGRKHFPQDAAWDEILCTRLCSPTSLHSSSPQRLLQSSFLQNPRLLTHFSDFRKKKELPSTLFSWHQIYRPTCLYPALSLLQ